MRTFVAVVLSSLALTACDCGGHVQARFPKLEIVDGAGAERTQVDFKQVQLNTKGTQLLRLRNSGAAALTVSAASFDKKLFGMTNPLPVVVEVGVDVEVELTFTPTEPDQVVRGAVTFTTDDPARPTATVALEGTGVTAVAIGNPTALDFGDVYLQESKTLDFTLTNAGSNDLVITDAAFSGAVPSTLTADLGAMKKTLHGGEALTTPFTFAPTARASFQGNLVLTFSGALGTMSVKVKGQAVQALPRLCFKYDDSPLETCTDQTTTFLSFAEGSYCDNELYPDDGGPSPCLGLDGGPTARARSAKAYLKNEGNTKVAYSLRYEARTGSLCADAGSSIDFQFSNAPDAGLTATWSEATATLPVNATDPQPWETAPIAITYRPRSHCAVDAADQARVVWTRQGEPAGTTRAPGTLILNLTGQSQLPKGVSQDITFNATPPVEQDFKGLGNAGDAPLTVTGVALWMGAANDAGVRGTTPGEACTAASTGDCAMFSWAPDAGPLGALPVVLAGTTNPSAPTTQVLGRIVFGADDAGVKPQLGKPYTVFAVITTNDPWAPRVVSTIKGTAH